MTIFLLCWSAAASLIATIACNKALGYLDKAKKEYTESVDHLNRSKQLAVQAKVALAQAEARLYRIYQKK